MIFPAGFLLYIATLIWIEKVPHVYTFAEKESLYKVTLCTEEVPHIYRIAEKERSAWNTTVLIDQQVREQQSRAERCTHQ